MRSRPDPIRRSYHHAERSSLVTRAPARTCPNGDFCRNVGIDTPSEGWLSQSFENDISCGRSALAPGRQRIMTRAGGDKHDARGEASRRQSRRPLRSRRQPAQRCLPRPPLGSLTVQQLLAQVLRRTVGRFTSTSDR